MTCKFLFKDHIKIISVVQYWRIKMQIFVHFLHILRPLEENNLNVKSNYHLCHYAENKTQKNWVQDRSQMLLRGFTLKNLFELLMLKGSLSF